jgi:hypothetical protein
VQMMVAARADLRDLLSSMVEKAEEGVACHPSAATAEKVFTERDCPGIGKNALLLSDALKGYHAYDEAVKAFAIEKVFP